jgi:PKHD-type hydroxylase
MLTIIEAVLNDRQLALAHRLIGEGKFVDGRSSAGKAAVRVKYNEELALDERQFRDLNNLVMGGLVKHPVYRSAVMPLRVAAPYYARYTPGMSYGLHVDDPLMGQGDIYRSDVSATIFLNPPDSYDGGELVVQTPFGEQKVKLAAGDAVIYPSSSLHRVAEVSRGERLVAITWIQSMVRAPDKRALLHELNQARETLLQERPEAAETARVNHSYINLVRMWSEL